MKPDPELALLVGTMCFIAPGSLGVAVDERGCRMKIIGIVGTRRRDTLADFRVVEAAFKAVYAPGDLIVSGQCPKGGDRFAELLAIRVVRPELTDPQLMQLIPHDRLRNIRDHSAPIRLYPADWNLHGRSAGFKRNTFIAQDADVLIACVSGDRTGGTEDTIGKFLNRFRKDEEKLILV